MSDDTIVAVASPPGVSPEAVLRLSGPDAQRLVRARFRPAAGAAPWPEPGAPRGVCLGWLVTRAGGAPVPARVYRMPGPRSFTGEDVVELHVPGNPHLVHDLLAALLADGARGAGPGEFTRRALEHGRIDLAQAESTIALIHAGSEADARAALAGLDGRASAVVDALRDGVLAASGVLEAALDFADRALGDDLEAQALARIDALLGGMARLTAGASGPLARDVPRVVLYGPTNAGKSTLLNALLGSTRARVDPRPGTTRDPVRATLDLDGRPVELVDPAGVGAPLDATDAAAQAATRALLATAELVLWVRSPDTRDVDRPAGEVLAVATKADLGPAASADVVVCALTGEGLPALRAQIARRLATRARTSQLLVSVRQRQVATRAGEALAAARDLLASGAGAELAAFELAEARRLLGEVTGAVDVEEVLGEIFARFCIGK